MLKNAERAASILSELLAYHHKPAGEFIIQAWLERISELMTDEEFEKAAKACIFECDRLPSIQDFIALIEGDKKAIEEAKIAEAWKVVLEGTKIATSTLPEHIARRRDLIDELEIPFQKALADMGGFYELGNVEVEKLHWSKQNFEKLCRIYLEGDEAKVKSDRHFESRLNRIINSGHNGAHVNQGLTALSGMDMRPGGASAVLGSPQIEPLTQWSGRFDSENPDDVEF